MFPILLTYTRLPGWMQLWRLACSGLLLTALIGCSLPIGSVAMFRDAPPAEFATCVKPLPSDWQGRLVRIGKGTPILGGDLTHCHTIGHQHQKISDPAPQVAEPLGMQQVCVDRTHRHTMESFSTEPATSMPASSLPISYSLEAKLVTKRFIYHVPTTLVVGYVGDQLPPGWVWCDGNNGTPDLRDRYIVLGPPIGPMGSLSHCHDATHSHQWGTAENVDHPAFIGDITPTQPPLVVAAARVHSHAVKTATNAPVLTELEENRPPALSLHFIMATPDAEKMPPGAVIAYGGDGAPFGWTDIRDIFGPTAVGHFLSAIGLNQPAGLVTGTTNHDHMFFSQHTLQLSPSPATGPTDRVGLGPPVPTAEHNHEVIVEETVNTGIAESLPPFVAMPVIIKN